MKLQRRSTNIQMRLNKKESEQLHEKDETRKDLKVIPEIMK